MSPSCWSLWQELQFDAQLQLVQLAAISGSGREHIGSFMRANYSKMAPGVFEPYFRLTDSEQSQLFADETKKAQYCDSFEHIIMPALQALATIFRNNMHLCEPLEAMVSVMFPMLGPEVGDIYSPPSIFQEVLIFSNQLEVIVKKWQADMFVELAPRYPSPIGKAVLTMGLVMTSVGIREGELLGASSTSVNASIS